MESKSINKRIKIYLKRARLRNHRTIFAILGTNVSYQVPYFYELLTRGKNKEFPVLCCSNNIEELRTVTWCPSFSSEHHNEKESSILPKITYLKYSDVSEVMYQSFKLAVLHNMENVTPSSLASIIEAVEGGGALIFFFSNIKNVDEFASTKVSTCLNSRFIKRLCASLAASSSFMILDDRLNILTDAPRFLRDLSESSNSEELQKLKTETASSDPVSGPLVNMCQTVDQAKLLLKFVDALKKNTSISTISVSSPKGRGKSAAFGLAIAASLAMNYSNIFISSLNYENVKIIFRFLFKGLDALNYKEDQDYDLIQSVNPKFNNALLGINVFKDNRQTVRFILPGDVENKLEQAELVIVDEAASIPIPLLNRLLGSYVVLMASTIEGCGGTGKFLYENMVRKIHQQASMSIQNKANSSLTLCPATYGSFEKHTLSEPIYYDSGDDVENWLNNLLCLKCSISGSLSQGCPDPQQCRLFYVCQEVLFSYESHAETFLQQLVSIFCSSKRTISPDILSKMADDPNFHIFCLLSPMDNTSKNVSPEILSAIMVHTEKHIPVDIAYSGEVLPDCFNEWKIDSMGEEPEFLPKHGIHILDIVTHPEYKRMGYGSRALLLLQEFYCGKWVPFDDSPFLYSSVTKKNTSCEKKTTPLLLQLSEVVVEKVDYLLVSYFLSPDLLKFWKKCGFTPIYVSKEKNYAQEHLCLMMKSLDEKFHPYLQENLRCFCECYFQQLNDELKCLPSSFALNLLKSSFSTQLPKKELTKEVIDSCLNPKRMKLLEKYCQNLCELRCIMPCLPVLAKLYFTNCCMGVVLPVLQEAILMSIGLQRNTADDISKDLGLPATQVHGLLNRTVRKLTNHLSSIIERTVGNTIKASEVSMQPASRGFDEDLEAEAKKIKQQQLEDLKKLKNMDFSQYAIKGSEDDWEKALHSGRKTLVSIQSIKKTENVEVPAPTRNTSFKKKHMKKKR